jgi:hypothetical protein
MWGLQGQTRTDGGPERAERAQQWHSKRHTEVLKVTVDSQYISMNLSEEVEEGRNCIRLQSIILDTYQRLF